MRAIHEDELWEGSDKVLRFRQFPKSNWFLAAAFFSGAVFVLVTLEENLLFADLKTEKVLLIMLILFGLLFLLTGKIKTIEFDKESKQLTIKKRTITCHCRTVTKYDYDEIMDVKAVWRGVRAGSVDTQRYAIVVDFVDNALKEETVDESYYMSSDLNDESIQFDLKLKKVN